MSNTVESVKDCLMKIYGQKVEVYDRNNKQDIPFYLKMHDMKKLVDRLGILCGVSEKTTILDLYGMNGHCSLFFAFNSDIRNVKVLDTIRKRTQKTRSLWDIMVFETKKHVKYDIVNRKPEDQKKFEDINIFLDLLRDKKETFTVWANMKHNKILVSFKKIPGECYIDRFYPELNFCENKNREYPLYIYRKPLYKNGLPSRLGIAGILKKENENEGV